SAQHASLLTSIALELPAEIGQLLARVRADAVLVFGDELATDPVVDFRSPPNDVFELRALGWIRRGDTLNPRFYLERVKRACRRRNRFLRDNLGNDGSLGGGARLRDPRLVVRAPFLADGKRRSNALPVVGRKPDVRHIEPVPIVIIRDQRGAVLSSESQAHD